MTTNQELDTRIMQKVNTHYRSAFQERFPGQCEHIWRLITERLHLGLTKTAETDILDQTTWRLSPKEIQELSHAIYLINQVRTSL